MKISFLPEVTSPTGSTVFPTVDASGNSKKVQLSTLNSFSGTGTVGNVFSGNNVILNPSPATTTSVIGFAFPGSIYPFPDTNIPDGWLLCNGQAISRTVYASLFDTIGITYGVGDNRTTFNLPDLRGRTVVGRETMGGVSSSGRLTNTLSGNIDGTVLGAVGGSENHTLTPSQASIRSHTHSYSASSVIYSGNQVVDARSSGCNTSNPGTGCGGGIAMSYQFTTLAASDSSSTAHNNLPPLVFLNWVIKY